MNQNWTPGDKEVVTISDQSRILITRLSHLGDCVLTLPLATAIKAHASNARIVWVVEKPGQQLMADHPAIDELIAVSSGWLKRPRQVLALRQQLREFAPDVCIDPQSLSKSSLLGWLSGAKSRVGFEAPIGREIAPYLNNELVAPKTEHLADRTLELLSPLGIPIPDVADFAFPRFPSAEESIQPFLDRQHLGCDFAVVNPGAGWASRRWPPRRFASVARHLGQKHQVPSVVAWAGEAERDMAEEIVARSGGYGILAEKTNLQELSELLRHAAFYVGGDTGPMHIAAAVGTPCVALYGPTLPGRSGAYGSQHIHVQAFHQTTNRKIGDEGMRAIEPEMVTEACDRMVERLAKSVAA